MLGASIPDLEKAMFKPDSEFAERLKKRKDKAKEQENRKLSANKKKKKLSLVKQQRSLEKAMKKKSSAKSPPPSGFENPLYEPSSSIDEGLREAGDFTTYIHSADTRKLSSTSIDSEIDRISEISNDDGNDL